MSPYIDLNISLPLPFHSLVAHKSSSLSSSTQSKKSKGKGKSKSDGDKDGDKNTMLMDEGDGKGDEEYGNEESERIKRIVMMGIKLGYSILTLNHTVPHTFDPSFLPRQPAPLIPSIDPRTQSQSISSSLFNRGGGPGTGTGSAATVGAGVSQEGQKQQSQGTGTSKTNLNSNNGGGGGGEGSIMQLSRVTVVLDERCTGGSGGGKTKDKDKIYGINSSFLPHYNPFSIISVLPLDPPSLTYACLSMSTNIEIIQIEVSGERPTGSREIMRGVKRKTLGQAIRHGCFFEVLYSPALFLPNSNSSPPIPSSSISLPPSEFNPPQQQGQPSSHPKHPPSSSNFSPQIYRRNFSAIIKDLVRLTGGKGIIVSSGARGWEGMRGGQDVVNLLTVLGLSPEQALQAVTVNPRKAIMRGFANRQTYRSVISQPTLTTTIIERSPTELLPTQTQTAGEGNDDDDDGKDDGEEMDVDVGKKRSRDDDDGEGNEGQETGNKPQQGRPKKKTRRGRNKKC